MLDKQTYVRAGLLIAAIIGLGISLPYLADASPKERYEYVIVRFDQDAINDEATRGWRVVGSVWASANGYGYVIMERRRY